MTNNIPSLSERQRFDYVVVATKNIPDCPPTVTDLITPAVTPGHTVIVLIQNGLNIEKPIFKKFQNNICLSGISMIGTREDEPSVIVQEGPDVLHIGAFHNPRLSAEKEIAAAKDFVNLYSASGKADCKFVEDVGYSRWRKLLYNACINPACALTGLDSGRIQLAGDAVDTLIKPAMAEIAEAARVCGGYELPPELFDQALSVDPIDRYIAPSMLIDTRKGNFTEYENILGEPLREGLSHGVSMPTLKVLYRLLEALQWKIKEERGMISIPPKL